MGLDCEWILSEDLFDKKAASGKIKTGPLSQTDLFGFKSKVAFRSCVVPPGNAT